MTMAAKRFHIATPEELTELGSFASEGKLDRLTSIWTTARRKGGTTRWDSAIFAQFSGDRQRKAEIMRMDANGQPVHCATLKYNLAHKWCALHLKPVSE